MYDESQLPQRRIQNLSPDLVLGSNLEITTAHVLVTRSADSILQHSGKLLPRDSCLNIGCVKTAAGLLTLSIIASVHACGSRSRTVKASKIVSGRTAMKQL